MGTTTTTLLAAFAIQASVELLDSILGLLLGERWVDHPSRTQILRLSSFGVALGVAFSGAADLLGTAFWQRFVTALAISGGTEGVNSILKIAAYTKFRQKVFAGKSVPTVVERGRMPFEAFVAMAGTGVRPSLASRPSLSGGPSLEDRPRPGERLGSVKAVDIVQSRAGAASRPLLTKLGTIYNSLDERRSYADAVCGDVLFRGYRLRCDAIPTNADTTLNDVVAVIQDAQA